MHSVTVALAAILFMVRVVGAERENSPAHTGVAQTQWSSKHPQRTARAVRADQPPRLDGVIDDEVWLRAPLQEGFTQTDPDNGAPSSLRTTFQVAYDDGAIYVAGICYDDPDSITARLSRRDDWLERDLFEITLDPYHDHHTGVFFNVGPSGWIGDGIIYHDDDWDDSWDSVAEAKTARRSDGWSLELKIPYHALRFGEKQSYIWGLNVHRRISRRAESASWCYTPRGVTGYASRFGHLEGIEGIRPSRSLELFPFALGRGTLSTGSVRGGGHALFTSAGIDLRYGLASNISLNATVNPDFGQVEGAPATLNLGVFETFIEERRPFFLEGIQLFESPRPNIVGIGRPSRLFHSRRIGRPPARFDLPENSAEVDRPGNTTILGAIKLSGKTGGRTAFGLLDAVAGREQARIDQRTTRVETGQVDTVLRTFEVEPVTNYFIGRVQQDLLTNATAGAQFTAVNGAGFDPAYVGAGDLHLKWWDNDYGLFSRLAVSRAGQAEERDTGWEGVLYFKKAGGPFGGQVYVDAQSPEFEANDLGYMRRNDHIQAGIHVYHEKLDPYRFARRSGFNLNVLQRWNFSGERLSRGVNVNTWNNLHNYWGFSIGARYGFDALDDRVTRGGPLMLSPAGTWIEGKLWTDDRKPIRAWLRWSVHWSRDGDNLRSRVGFKVEMQPVSCFELEFEPGYNFNRNFAQWLENEDEDGDGEDDHFLFGDLESRVFDVEVRSTWAFTPGMSLQLYMHLFVTTGDYGAVKALAYPRSYEFVPYVGLEDNPDFHRRALRLNGVLRWEYRPGSTLFVVLQQRRDRDFADAREPKFRPLSDLGRTFGDEGDRIFLIKFNRWIGL